MSLYVYAFSQKAPAGGQKMSLYSREDLERSFSGGEDGEEADVPPTRRDNDDVDVEWDLPPNDWVGWTVYKIHKGLNWIGKLFHNPSASETDAELWCNPDYVIILRCTDLFSIFFAELPSLPLNLILLESWWLQHILFTKVISGHMD